MSSKSVGLIQLVIIALFSLLAVRLVRPPKPVPASAPATGFSAERAMKHLAVIAARPHPLGSLEHDSVRDYILNALRATGMSPTVQVTTAVRGRRAATVQNIVARVSGRSTRGTVMLACHYDSVPAGPGAGDDGAGVAALLESARALSASSPLQNDVLFLFTDGEEAGMFGAQAFVDEHPWAKDVSVAINFEARGDSGPSLLFETSVGNEWLVSQFSRAAPHPMGASLAYAVYKLMPNDTDFSIFKTAGMKGLNFAFISDRTRYHTSLDTVENISRASLQHHGSYALALARRFGTMTPDSRRANDAAYFNLLGPLFLCYSQRWTVPLTASLLALVVLLAATGLRRRRLRGAAILAGVACALVGVLVTLGFGMLLWGLCQRAQGRWLAPADILTSGFHMVGLAFLAVAGTSFTFHLFRKKFDELSLWLGGLLWWLLLSGTTAVAVPDANYLFAWPLAFTLVPVSVGIFRPDRSIGSGMPFLTSTVCSLPGVLLLIPTLYLVFVALGLDAIGTAALLVLCSLTCWMFTRAFELALQGWRWRVPVFASAVSLVLVVAGSLTAGYDARRPMATNVSYCLDGDTGKALWAATGGRLNGWSSLFMTQHAVRKPLPRFAPGFGSGLFLQDSAPTVSVGIPEVQLLADTESAGSRMLKLRILSPGHPWLASLAVPSPAAVLSATVNGKPVPTQARATGSGGATDAEDVPPWRLDYFGPPESGFDVELRVKASEPIRVAVVVRTPGLPAIPGVAAQQRPADTMPIHSGDLTIVRKTFRF